MFSKNKIVLGILASVLIVSTINVAMAANGNSPFDVIINYLEGLTAKVDNIEANMNTGATDTSELAKITTGYGSTTILYYGSHWYDALDFGEGNLKEVTMSIDVDMGRIIVHSYFPNGGHLSQEITNCDTIHVVCDKIRFEAYYPQTIQYYGDVPLQYSYSITEPNP